MKSKATLILSIICFIAIIIFSGSCGPQYEREDILEKYLDSNSNKFNNERNFHLLTFRYFPLSCAMTHFGFDADSIINFIADSLQNQKLYVLTDDNVAITQFNKSCSNNNLHFIKGETKELEKYGFYYMPHLFHIKNNSIIKWKKINTKKTAKIGF